MFLRAQFAITLGISSIAIVTVDSDIDILTLIYSLYLETQIVLQLGSALTIRYLDISATTLTEYLRKHYQYFTHLKDVIRQVPLQERENSSV